MSEYADGYDDGKGAQFDELLIEIAAKQAQIDRLMFEYCPEEMTEEQVNEWKKHQQPVKEEGK